MRDGYVGRENTRHPNYPYRRDIYRYETATVECPHCRAWLDVSGEDRGDGWEWHYMVIPTRCWHCGQLLTPDERHALEVEAEAALEAADQRHQR